MHTFGTRSIQVAALAVAVCTLTGCARFGMKTVASKNPPTQLVATDGSHCNVSEKRWEATLIGMKVMCDWQGASIRSDNARGGS